MKKSFALMIVLLLALGAGWWWHTHRGADRFDYAAVFEQPTTAARAASLADVVAIAGKDPAAVGRSEEHTSELQSLMRISYAVFCLKKKKKKNHSHIRSTINLI